MGLAAPLEVDYLGPMKTPVDKITEQALALSPEERAQLVDRLAESLDPQLADAYQAAWAAEARRRLEELQAGTIRPVSLSKALAMVRKRLTE